MTGRTLGDFTVLEKLGEGGYGVVYRAEQRTLAREAVVKVLHARHGANDRVVQRFLRESQLASRLDHPYAAHIYSFGAEPDGLLWIAMELVRGTPLSKVLAAQPGGRMPLGRFVSLLDRICEVVHTAHEQGIVHRDLKPDNIMVLSRAGRLLPKLLDLGIAKLVTGAKVETIARADAALPDASVDAAAATLETSAPPSSSGSIAPVLTQHGAVVGSPHYMAPEQWTEGAVVDARTDVYALGVLTWEAVTGALPFGGASIPEIARGHLRGEVPHVPDDLPPALDGALRAALAKRPDDRPASALAFAESVRAAAGLRMAADALPRLDDGLRADVAWMPQPIADAFAALEAARNPHQARDALWTVVGVAARWLGVIALAARSRVGPGPGQSADAPAIVDALRALHRRDLDDEDWIDLLRALARPFAAARDAHPLPELVEVALAEPSPFAALFALRATEGASSSEESLRDRLARTLPVLAPLLRALSFLNAYQVVVRRGDRAEVWMGQRRSPRPLVVATPDMPEGGAVLADLDGRPVVDLAPLVAVAAPAPGAADELFVFAGPGRARGRGARLVAEPHGFERHDDRVWDWFRDRLLSVEEGGAAVVEDAPYRGLAAFTAADAELFFGRERAAEAFLNQLLVVPLLAVVGPSGAGKSSFVQAGVLPLVPPGWRHVVIRPGAAPMAVFESRVEVSSIAAAANETLVIVVDQFEELFTLCADVSERERFAAALVAAARDERVRVVITLRDDFLVRAGELPALRDRLGQGLTLLGTPAPDDLLRIVVEPARRAGYDFDDKDLPMRMVRAVAGQPGALALLSFTASQLWDLRDRHFKRLTRKSYDAIGGVEGALAAHADATLSASSPDEQRLTRDAFRHLVTAEGTRAVLTRRELDDVLGKSPHAGAVIERLVRARLLVASESESGDDRLEIIHEALITAWPRLVQWRRDDAEGARLRDQLRAAARQWADRDRPRGLLWRDDALDDYRRWRTRWPGALPELDEAFATASLRDAARGRRLRRTLAATAAAVLVSATIALSLLYRSSQHNAAESHDRLISSYVEQGRRLLLDGDYLRALPYLSAAYSAGDDSTAVRFLLHRATLFADLELTRHDQGNTIIAAVAFRPDGTHVMSVGWNGSAAIWDAASGHVIAALPAAGRNAIPAISVDGAFAVVPRATDTVIWSGAVERTLPAADHVAIDPRGATIALAAGTDISMVDRTSGTIRWRASIGARIGMLAVTGDRVLVLDESGRIHDVGPDAVTAITTQHSVLRIDPAPGGMVTLVEGSAVEIWDGGAHQLRRLADDVPATFVAISHDRRVVAIASRNGGVRLYTGPESRLVGVLESSPGVVERLSFSADDSLLATVSNDLSLRVWDVARQHLLVTLLGARDAYSELAFDADGRRVVGGGRDGVVHVFAVREPTVELDVDGGEALGVCRFSRDGTQIFFGSEHATEVRTADTGARVARVERPPGGEAHVSPDGTSVVVPLEGTDANVQDVATGAVRARLVGAAPIISADFDRDGRRIVTTYADGTIGIFTGDGRKIRKLRGSSAALSASFSPDGARIVTAGRDGTARVWRIDTGDEIARVTGHNETIAAAFDSSGEKVLSANVDKIARLWDVALPGAVESFEHAATLNGAAISDDGAFVAGAATDGSVTLWDVRGATMLAVSHHSAAAEFVGFDPIAPRLLSTSDDHHAIIWDVSLELRSPDEVARYVRCRSPYGLSATGGETDRRTDCQ